MSERSTRHPFTNALYELQPDGNIRVTEGDRSALFSGEGRWISGDLKECDPQLCVWIANNPEANQPTESDSHLAQAAKPRRAMSPPATAG